MKIYEKELINWEEVIPIRNNYCFCPKCKHNLVEYKAGYETEYFNDNVFECTNCGFICKFELPFAYSLTNSCSKLPDDIEVDKIPRIEKTFSSEVVKRGVSFNGTCLSMYEVLNTIKEVDLKEGGTTYLKLPAINRFSLNLETGESYIYVNDKFDSRNNVFKKITFTQYYQIHITDKDMLFVFWNTFNRIKRLPLKFDVFKENKYDIAYTLSLPTGERCKMTSFSEFELMMSLLNKCPNLILNADLYKKEYHFTRLAKTLGDHNVWDTTTNTGVSVYAISTKEFRNSLPKTLIDTNEFVAHIAHSTNIPLSKSAKRIYANNNLAMGTMHFWIKAGFSDINNLLELTEKTMHISLYRNLENAVIKFIKDILSQVKDETIIKNKILNAIKFDALSLIEDIVIMRKKVREAGLVVPAFSGSMVEYHDSLVIISNNIKTERKNQDIQYTKTENNYVYSENEYNFLLPEDTTRLMNIGNAMNICVGRCYSEPAVNKKCTIMYITDSEGDYKACIEIRKKKLMQVKAKYNNAIKDLNLATAIRNWVQKKGINTNNCFDYDRMVSA